MKYIKLFEEFKPSDIPQTEPQFTLWMLHNAPKAVANPQEWFEEQTAKPEPDWVFIISIIKELGIANRLSIPKGAKEELKKGGYSESLINSLSLLHWAAIWGHTAIAKALIGGGAKLDVQDEDKQTPLHWAALEGHTAIAKALIDAGAKLDVQDDYKRTPLHRAAEWGYIELVKALIGAGAKLDVRDYREETPWDVADSEMREVLPQLNPDY